MTPDADIIRELKRSIAEVEQETGEVPHIELLAELLGISTSSLRRIIARFLLSESTEGASAHKTKLRSILLVGSPTSRRSWGEGLQLRERQVMLVDEEGARIGVMPTRQALEIAKHRGLDLFLINPNSNPPVARIMDYCRYKFDLQKSARLVRRKNHRVKLKTVKLRYETGTNDLEIKFRQCRDFLSKGDKVQIVIALDGDEMNHVDLAIGLMTRFAEQLKDFAVVDTIPELQGNTVVLNLKPTEKHR